MVVATAKECLKSIEAKYEMVATTSISSALGPIVLIRITQSGNCLIGGPSTSTEMEMIIQTLKAMNIKKILIDGAFSRKTVTTSSDACFYVVGASYSSSLEKVIEQAKETLLQFSFPQSSIAQALINQKTICLLKSNKLISLPYDTIFGNEETLINQFDNSVKGVFFPGALTASFIKRTLQRWKELTPEMIIKTPTHFISDERVMSVLHRFNGRISVVQPINLVGVMYNPFSPLGFEFDDDNFQLKLKSITDLPVINVKKEMDNDSYE